MKVAPIHRALARSGRLEQALVHTGQHYDEKMSSVFFEDLGLPQPDASLGVGSGTQAEQTARALVALEKVLLERRPALVSVVGDVNSTLAAALCASKLGVPLAHVEAGLRSFDRSMPEEINRLVVDRLSDLLLTPSADADQNLAREGVDRNKIRRVGNVMIDSLMAALPRACALDMPGTLGLEASGYAVCTLHRPANVDDPKVLGRILGGLAKVCEQVPVIFPVHPRTRSRLQELGPVPERLRTIDPLGYLDFLSLTSAAALILTDSGGLQEESTALGIPCLTLRHNTERPVTVLEGTNILVGTDPTRIAREAERILEGQGKRGHVPALWDGRTGERIAQVYEEALA